MSAESALVAALQADSGITGLVNDRIFLFEKVQGNPTLPYIAYESPSSVPVESPETGKETNETVIDVACYAETLTAAKTLATLVRAVLIQQLDAAVIENTQDQRDRDTRRKAVVQSYRIWHVEDFP